MEIHFNKEWLNGFVEALFQELDWTIGPFLSDLSAYDVSYERCQNECGNYKIKIHFDIIGDNRADLFSYAYLRTESTTVELKAKVEQLAEEIIATIKTFRNQ